MELFYRLSKDSPHNKTIRKSSFQKENSSIQQAVSYIKKNFDQHISLRTLGELTGYTPNHFQRVFTKIMNISPQKYLENIRISQAKHLLATSDMPIVEIAYACGFSSQSYFSLLFNYSPLNLAGGKAVELSSGPRTNGSVSAEPVAAPVKAAAKEQVASFLENR